jgi:hypothetical protein
MDDGHSAQDGRAGRNQMIQQNGIHNGSKLTL